MFVANFVGHTNLINAKLEAKDSKAYLCMPGGYKVAIDTIKEDEIKDQDVVASIRPEEFIVNAQKVDGVKAVIEDSVFLGLNTHYFVKFADGETAEIIQESQIDSIIPAGTEVYLTIKTDKINIFDAKGEHNLVKGVINDLDQYKGK